MWRDHEGHRRSRKLGARATMTKTQARQALFDHINILGINNTDGDTPPPPSVVEPLREPMTVGAFLDGSFLPFYREKKWKASTASTTAGRINSHIRKDFRDRAIDSFTREELQEFLDRKAQDLSFSMVDHLRHDLKIIFRLARADDLIRKDPTLVLATPREATRKPKRTMTWSEFDKFLALEFPLRERLIIRIALLMGMRPGEILALRRECIKDDHLVVKERLYRGMIATPKTTHSVREVSIPPGVKADLNTWLAMLPNQGPESWVFPTEAGTSPVSKDNVWGWSKKRVGIKPILDAAGLGWVNFQVLRRSHATFMRDRGVDPKLIADQLGHTLDVSVNVYTTSMRKRRLAAVEDLEAAAGTHVN